MSEWLNVPVSKTGGLQGLGGSNPPLSANEKIDIYRKVKSNSNRVAFCISIKIKIFICQCFTHLFCLYFKPASKQKTDDFACLFCFVGAFWSLYTLNIIFNYLSTNKSMSCIDHSLNINLLVSIIILCIFN